MSIIFDNNERKFLLSEREISIEIILKIKIFSKTKKFSLKIFVIEVYKKLLLSKYVL